MTNGMKERQVSKGELCSISRRGREALGYLGREGGDRPRRRLKQGQK